VELTLNLCWSLLAAGALGMALRRCSAQPARIRALVTVACALALLFPVISLSDDLHTSAELVENSGLAQLKGVSQQRLGAGTPPPTIFVAALVLTIQAAHFVAVGLAPAFDTSHTTQAYFPPASGRAPPVVSI
jgi:hypothetical protein